LSHLSFASISKKGNSGSKKQITRGQKKVKTYVSVVRKCSRENKKFSGQKIILNTVEDYETEKRKNK